MHPGYVKLWRHQEFWDLVKDHKAFALAAVIAVRARRTTGLNLHGLKIGEALLGDYREYGMTEGQYRAAKERLNSAGFATFSTTNKGTIARLMFTGVFDPNLESNNEQDSRPATDSLQQASDKPDNRPTTTPTTTNKEKGEKRNEKNPVTRDNNVSDTGNCTILHKPEKAKRVKLECHTDFMRADVTAIACTLADELPDSSNKCGPGMGWYSKQLKALAARIGDESACDIFREDLFRYWSEAKAGEGVRSSGAAIVARVKKIMHQHGGEAA